MQEQGRMDAVPHRPRQVLSYCFVFAWVIRCLFGMVRNFGRALDCFHNCERTRSERESAGCYSIVLAAALLRYSQPSVLQDQACLARKTVYVNENVRDYGHGYVE